MDGWIDWFLLVGIPAATQPPFRPTERPEGQRIRKKQYSKPSVENISMGRTGYRRCRCRCRRTRFVVLSLVAVQCWWASLWTLCSTTTTTTTTTTTNALSTAGNPGSAHKHNNKKHGCDPSAIREARERFDAWRNNSGGGTAGEAPTKTFVVREEDLSAALALAGGDPRSSRIGRFAAGVFPEGLPSPNAANLACRAGRLVLNGARVSGGRRLVAGDVLAHTSDRTDRRTAVPSDPERAERFCASRLRLLGVLGDGGLSHAPLRVLYEDSCMAIVCKPAGIHTMSWSGSFGRSLCLDEVLPLLLAPPADPGRGAPDGDESLPAPLPRHRLDHRVAGPVVVAKTRRACVEIGRAFEEKTVTKEYRAIVVGEIDADAIAEAKGIETVVAVEGAGGAAADPAATKRAKPLSFTIRSDVDGKPSETDVVVLGTTPCNVNGVLTDLKLYPRTGRRHQLRIHCARILGTPILGDDLYWEEVEDENTNDDDDDDADRKQEGVAVRRRQGLYLYCKSVSIDHPLMGDRKRVSAAIDEPLRFARTRKKARKGFEWTVARAAEAGGE